MNHKTRTFRELLSTMFKSHPWHGVTAGADAPAFVTSYIEIAPPGEVKLELDKGTGHLHVDRPQRFSSNCPTLYGFIPQTYCGDGISKLANKHAKNKTHRGDGDPLDICVLTEKPIQHGDIMVRAVPIGGLRMIDGNESDDKIIAVLHRDALYGEWTDIAQCPESLIERLRHYFLTYKDIPGATKRETEITHVFGAEEAHRI
ncbi:MAG TPA: inorganic pyrophosphatase, partial [Candidatus Obscuribacter sp.]|nr:inorganic pyrophosphatase [Candidatus Obscuribacter sp.]